MSWSREDMLGWLQGQGVEIDDIREENAMGWISLAALLGAMFAEGIHIYWKERIR